MANSIHSHLNPLTLLIVWGFALTGILWLLVRFPITAGLFVGCSALAGFVIFVCLYRAFPSSMRRVGRRTTP
jgi:hypothetical protein